MEGTTQAWWRRVLWDRAFSWVWLLLRVYVGWEWLKAGWEKITGAEPGFWGPGVGKAMAGFWMKGAGLLTGPDGKPLPGSAHWWYRDFLMFLLNTHQQVWFSYFISISEFLVGLALILGFLTPVAAAGGALMNLNYMLAGVASVNGWMYTLTLLILLAGLNAGSLGVDRWLWPILFGRRGQATAGAGGGR
ncbi:MAG: DoxX family membrane protein [Bacillota bacterium]|nr:DoxX family membrane protein [Bacillota bacterium]